MRDEFTVADLLKWLSAFHLSFTGNSLRGRLLKLLLSSISFLLLLVSLLAYVNSHREADELFDVQLAESARVLLDQASTEISEGSGVVSDSDHPTLEYERKIAFQIRDSNGRLLLRSATTPRRILSEHSEGFSDSLIDGRKWRVYSHWNRAHTLQIQVGQLRQIRNELAGRIALSLLVPFLLTIPMIAPLVCDPDDAAFGLVPRLSDGKRHAVVVVDTHRRPIGMITQTDLLAVICRHNVLQRSS
ncbi:MAG TPA: sensor histidine kinase N-terminal domain-containing protein [Burkholderiales bacterium]|nr:sensor histidine kinase N-terminal domain-containing protein [Burkholderiales bacterium]